MKSGYDIVMRLSLYLIVNSQMTVSVPEPTLPTATLGLSSDSLSATIHKIYDRAVRDAGIGLKADLASTAVGISDFYTSFPNLCPEFSQGIFVEFRMCHTFISRKSAASHSFRHKHL